MANLRLMIVVIIGVLQVCTANPISVEEETDVAKLFSASELQRAKDAGISDQSLLEAKSYGLTFDEMIKLRPLNTDPKARWGNNTVDHMTKVCEILVPDHKTAADISDSQKINFMPLLQSVLPMAKEDGILFVRTSVCAYLSQPSLYEKEASSFGLQLIPYMKFRFLKLKNRNNSGVERVYVAQKMCCVYQGRDNTSDSMHKLTSIVILDEDLNKFDELWSEFETTNTSKSIENVCNFLSSINQSAECRSVLSVQ